MARRNLWDINQGIGTNGKRPGVVPPGGGTRDPVYAGPGQATEEYGQQQWGPGTQSSLSNWTDWYGGGGWWQQNPDYQDDQDWGGFSSWFEQQGITNMSDLYDYYLGIYNVPGFGGDPSQWGTDPNTQYSADDPWNPIWGDIGGGVEGFIEGEGYGGGAQGGAGDLGTGNVFIGGGMGSSMYGEGMTGQDCASLGPQYNMQGDCIACCGAQYAGEGFYGTGEEFVPEEGTVDPGTDLDCNSLYEQAGGFDGTQLSFSEFTSLYC